MYCLINFRLTFNSISLVFMVLSRRVQQPVRYIKFILISLKLHVTFCFFILFQIVPVQHIKDDKAFFEYMKGSNNR